MSVVLQPKTNANFVDSLSKFASFKWFDTALTNQQALYPGIPIVFDEVTNELGYYFQEPWSISATNERFHRSETNYMIQPVDPENKTMPVEGKVIVEKPVVEKPIEVKKVKDDM